MSSPIADFDRRVEMLMAESNFWGGEGVPYEKREIGKNQDLFGERLEALFKQLNGLQFSENKEVRHELETLKQEKNVKVIVDHLKKVHEILKNIIPVAPAPPPRQPSVMERVVADSLAEQAQRTERGAEETSLKEFGITLYHFSRARAQLADDEDVATTTGAWSVKISSVALLNAMKEGGLPEFVNDKELASHVNGRILSKIDPAIFKALEKELCGKELNEEERKLVVPYKEHLSSIRKSAETFSSNQRQLFNKLMQFSYTGEGNPRVKAVIEGEDGKLRFERFKVRAEEYRKEPDSRESLMSFVNSPEFLEADNAWIAGLLDVPVITPKDLIQVFQLFSDQPEVVQKKIANAFAETFVKFLIDAANAQDQKGVQALLDHPFFGKMENANISDGLRTHFSQLANPRVGAPIFTHPKFIDHGGWCFACSLTYFLQAGNGEKIEQLLKHPEFSKLDGDQFAMVLLTAIQQKNQHLETFVNHPQFLLLNSENLKVIFPEAMQAAPQLLDKFSNLDEFERFQLNDWIDVFKGCSHEQLKNLVESEFFSKYLMIVGSELLRGYRKEEAIPFLTAFFNSEKFKALDENFVLDLLSTLDNRIGLKGDSFGVDELRIVYNAIFSHPRVNGVKECHKYLLHQLNHREVNQAMQSRRLDALLSMPFFYSLPTIAISGIAKGAFIALHEHKNARPEYRMKAKVSEDQMRKIVSHPNFKPELLVSEEYHLSQVMPEAILFGLGDAIAKWRGFDATVKKFVDDKNWSNEVVEDMLDKAIANNALELARHLLPHYKTSIFSPGSYLKALRYQGIAFAPDSESH